ncbi:baseplate assembly protein [Sphingomonas sp. Mn802worker]|uniref:baseplate assembly protein n=1 Tax=Sphingomonas sp. Mn802worker TaxID=629773 RepID=UPI00035EC275|nr:baseplate J/gp47 family protein [Sphingomonas sp. Mn802worker]
MPATSSTSVDLSRLAPPTIVEQLDYETILAGLIARVQAELPSFDAAIDSDPAVKVLQIAAYEQMMLRADFNDRLQARLVAYAVGATLDHIGAAIGVARLPAESDDALRARIVLGPEGFAAAGPELAYVKRARDAGAQVLDASAVSPAPGEVLVSVLSAEGDGTASIALLATVRAIVTDKAVRPLGDLVTVASAAQVRFTITANLWTFAGPDPALVVSAARTKLAAYLSDARRLGHNVTLSGLYAALTAEGVQRVELLSPTADIVCDMTQAALCTAVTVTHAGYDD